MEWASVTRRTKDERPQRYVLFTTNIPTRFCGLPTTGIGLDPMFGSRDHPWNTFLPETTVQPWAGESISVELEANGGGVLD